MPAYHVTVNSVLDQLEKKRYLTRDRNGYARFTATIDRSTLIGSQLEQFADSYFGGASTPMLLPMVD